MPPMKLKGLGMYFLFAAATVRRPMTNTLLLIAPTMTRQIRTAKTMPALLPRSALMAVYFLVSVAPPV